MRRRKIYSSHKPAEKNSCFSPTDLPKKTSKEYTLSSSERGKGYHTKFLLHPEPKILTVASPQHGPLHISMGKKKYSQPPFNGWSQLP